MAISLLNAEDLSSLLVFDTLSSDWVREVHMFKSQRRKKEKTFVIFRNFRNKKISSLEELKEEFDDADFLDNAQFKSGQSHDIVSNKVGANKTARKSAKAWMAEAASRPTAHQPKVILVPKNINEKALNKEVKLTKVNKNTSDDATLLNVVKAIKQATPELEKVPVTKSAVATAQVKPSVMETVEVSKAPPIRPESIKNPTQNEAATPIVKPALPIKTSDAEETRENIQVTDAIKPVFAGLPFGSHANVKYLEEKLNQTAVTKKEEDTDWKAKNIKEDHTVLKEVKGELPQFSKPVFASFTAGDLAEAWTEDDVGILNYKDQKKTKEIPLLLAQPSKPEFAGLPFDDSADAWMDEDIGIMEDADIEEDMIREVKKHSAEIEEIKHPLEDYTHYATDQIETSINQNVGVIKPPKYDTPLHTITEIENKSVNKKPPQDAFPKDENYTKERKKENKENPLSIVQTSKTEFTGFHFDDSWMHKDIGIMEDDDDEEDMIREEKEQKQNPNKIISCHDTGLVEVLQTFLAESENAGAGRAAEVASKQVEVKKDEEDSKLGIDLPTFFDIENKSDESDETDGNSDESMNDDTDDTDLGSKEETKYLKEVFLQNKPDENISGNKKPGHEKFSAEDICMKVGKTEIEENPLLLVQTSKPAFAGLPADDSADAWMHDDVGIIDDDEDSEEENVQETIPQYKSGLVEVLQTFLAESENPAAGSTSEAASKQVVVKTNEEDSKLGTDLETFFDDEDNDTDESDETDSNRDESLNYDTDESELGSSESAPDP